jgi:putative transposase
MKQELVKVVLSEQQQAELASLTRKGKQAVRKVKRARVLLALHQGEKPSEAARLAGVSQATVYNIHNRYLSGKLKAALAEKPRSGQPRKVTQRVEAAITRIACSEAPEGRSRWTVSLINNQLVTLGYQVDDESVRLVLKKANSSPGLKGNGALGR